MEISFSSPSPSPSKRPRLTQYNSSAQGNGNNAARDLLSGALNEAIKSRDVKEEEEKHAQVEQSPTKSKQGSPAKSPRGIRRKRRRDLAEGSEFHHHTFVIKLFDRSVDLAQFRPATPLYPVCRAWMRNQPSNVQQGPRDRSPTPPPEDNGVVDGEGDVYSLPSPVPLEKGGQAEGGGGGGGGAVGRSPRLPPPGPPPVLEGLHLDLEQTDATPPAILLSNHMVRWWGVKKAWKHAAAQNEKRYEKSLNFLKEMFDK